MMNDKIRDEQWSALMDGELSADEAADLLASLDEGDGLNTWYAYHVVGDVLRSAELAPDGQGMSLLQGVRAGLAQEPTYPQALQAAPLQLSPMPAANASVFRWKMVAGLASFAAVAAVGWGAYNAQQIDSRGGAQLAAAPAAVQVAPSPTTATAVATADGGSAVMIRDPRLDELLAAHSQFGATNSLQMPAEFLRNATFAQPKR